MSGDGASSRISRTTRRAFVLLEVTAAVVILGIASAVFMRSFIQSLHAQKRLEITLRAGFLAQSVVETLDLFPPEEGKIEGSFAEDPTFGEPYRFYSYLLETEYEEIDYEDVSLEGTKRDLFPLIKVHLRIVYDDGRNKRFVPVDLYTAVVETDPFAPAVRQQMQLF